MKRIAAAVIGLLLAASQSAHAEEVDFIFDYVQPSFPNTDVELLGAADLDGEGGYSLVISKTLDFLSEESIFTKNTIVEIRYLKQRFGDIAANGATLETDNGSLRIGKQFEWGEQVRPFAMLGYETFNLRTEGPQDLSGNESGYSVTVGSKFDMFEEGLLAPLELTINASVIKVSDLGITDLRLDAVYWLDDNIGAYLAYGDSTSDDGDLGGEDLFTIDGLYFGIRASLLSSF